MIKRALSDIINSRLFGGKTILLFGARQVGKTTLLKMIQQNSKEKTLWLNGDNHDDRAILENINSTRAKELFPPKSVLIIDEAQRIENAGLSLKIIHDNCPEIQMIATGSSAFELTDKIRESLTGRKWSFKLYPISMEELASHTNRLELLRTLETRLVYGSYPDIINHAGNEKEVLNELTSDYLYKDIFRIKEIRKPDLIEKLVKALAFQVGNQVSFRELSTMIQADSATVERYIYLLEEAYIIFRLPSFARNLRNELKKTRKIYFIDNGIRNAVINQFNPVSLRNDVGALWENLMISERIKRNEYQGNFRNIYFWRTTRQQEIDYLEEYDGKLKAYEFKWQTKKTIKPPPTFLTAYPTSEFSIVTSENFLEFVL
jgi:predicted AAA+ superfamily ATPase